MNWSPGSGVSSGARRKICSEVDRLGTAPTLGVGRSGAVLALAGLLAAGQWLQPRLDGPTEAAPSTRPAPTSPSTSPILAIDRPAGPPGVTRIVATSSHVDAIAVTRQAVWLAVGGLVLRVDPATSRALVVSGVDAGAPPVGRPGGRGWGGLDGDQRRRAAPDRPAHRPADRVAPGPGQRRRHRRGRGVGGVLPGPGPARAGHPPRPGQRPGHRQRRPPDPPLAVGAGPGAVWVRGAEGWLWRVDPAGDRQAGAIRLPTVPGGAELAGKLVVASGVLWVTDPGPGVVRRVDLRSGTEDRWEADGRHLAVTPGGTVWATSDTRLLGLGGPQVRGPRRNLHELETDRITAMAAAEDGGLWLGTARGLFHVDRSVLRQG
jgi:hypothetical protein